MAQYKFKCKHCDSTFITHNRYRAHCPRHEGGEAPTFIEDVLDLAVDVAVAYVAADIVSDVAGGLFDAIGGLFD